jgi:hypothetical protein
MNRYSGLALVLCFCTPRFGYGQGVNLAAYCAGHYGTSVKNIDNTGYGWRCEPDRNISVDQACKEQYDNTYSAALLTPAPGGPNDWVCRRASAPPQQSNGRPPDWQINSKWCTQDQGSSGRAYRNACTQVDQYDSVISCQQDARNGRAVQSIQQAGKEAVNAFMDGIKPSQCRSVPHPPTADYYVVGRFRCNPSGSCDLATHSPNSCSEAYSQFDQEVAKRGNNACRQCQMNVIDNSKSVAEGPTWIHSGMCPRR